MEVTRDPFVVTVVTSFGPVRGEVALEVHVETSSGRVTLMSDWLPGPERGLGPFVGDLLAAYQRWGATGTIAWLKGRGVS